MEVSVTRSQENGPKAENDKTARATGLGRRTKVEICKSGIKLAAPRFQTTTKSNLASLEAYLPCTLHQMLKTGLRTF